MPKTLRNYKGNDILQFQLPSAASSRQQSREISGASEFDASLVTKSLRASLVSKDDMLRWKICLKKGEEIVRTGPIGKKNNYGITQMRQLILTTAPRLIYAEPSSQSVKGEIECASKSSPATSSSSTNFEVKTSNGRVFKFSDASKDATGWVTAINLAYS